MGAPVVIPWVLLLALLWLSWGCTSIPGPEIY
ncbi:hypothetical protein KpIITR008_8 [Klebsiella phage KpIITR008]